METLFSCLRRTFSNSHDFGATAEVLMLCTSHETAKTSYPAGLTKLCVFGPQRKPERLCYHRLSRSAVIIHRPSRSALAGVAPPCCSNFGVIGLSIKHRISW